MVIFEVIKQKITADHQSVYIMVLLFLKSPDLLVYAGNWIFSNLWLKLLRKGVNPWVMVIDIENACPLTINQA